MCVTFSKSRNTTKYKNTEPENVLQSIENKMELCKVNLKDFIDANCDQHCPSLANMFTQNFFTAILFLIFTAGSLPPGGRTNSIFKV